MAPTPVISLFSVYMQLELLYFVGKNYFSGAINTVLVSIAAILTKVSLFYF